jgi:membrane protein
LHVLKQTVTDWLSDNCVTLAAALACYAVLSLAPLVIIIFKLFSVAVQESSARQLITDQVHSLLGNAGGGDLVNNILNSKHQKSGTVATIIGIVVLLFGASGVFGQLQTSINTVWGVKPKESGGVWRWLRSRFLSASMVVGLGFLLLVSFLVSTVIASFAHYLAGGAQALSIVLDVVLSLATVTVMVAVIYKWLPDVKVRWRDVWLGAFFTAVLFALGKWGLSLYFRFAAPSSAYGLFGALVAVIIWVYYAAQILFFGAEFTKVNARAHGRKFEPTSYSEPAEGKDKR